MRLRIHILNIALFITLVMAPPSDASDLTLNQGLMMIGGQVSMPFEYNFKPQTILSLKVQPEFSYFVFSNFSLSSGLSVESTIHDSLEEDIPVIWSANVAARYYFDVGSVFLYAGFGISLGANDLALVSLRWSFDFPMGVLVPLSKYIGLTFAFPVSIQFKTTSFFEKVTFTPGYFGVSAFF